MLYDLLQESANQILSLSTKTLEEMKSDTLAGPLYIGTGQTDNLKEVVKMMKLFQERYPHIQFHLLSDDKEKLLKHLYKINEEGTTVIAVTSEENLFDERIRVIDLDGGKTDVKSD